MAITLECQECGYCSDYETTDPSVLPSSGCPECDAEDLYFAEMDEKWIHPWNEEDEDNDKVIWSVLPPLK